MTFIKIFASAMETKWIPLQGLNLNHLDLPQNILTPPPPPPPPPPPK